MGTGIALSCPRSAVIELVACAFLRNKCSSSFECIDRPCYQKTHLLVIGLLQSCHALSPVGTDHLQAVKGLAS